MQADGETYIRCDKEVGLCFGIGLYLSACFFSLF